LRRYPFTGNTPVTGFIKLTEPLIYQPRHGLAVLKYYL
jgi:hypothetical protein